LPMLFAVMPAGDCWAQQDYTQDTAYVRFSNQELEKLVSPIALYPDPLIAQILPASTYPLQLSEAARWLEIHRDSRELDQGSWEPSIMAVAHYPSVLRMMTANMSWTADLAAAFINQEQDLMDTIQRLREEARNAGTLRSDVHQTVVVEDGFIRIVPANPAVLYVPLYNPEVVYIRPAADYLTPLVTFSLGFAIGAWLDVDTDWHDHYIYYHRSPGGWGDWYYNHYRRFGERTVMAPIPVENRWHHNFSSPGSFSHGSAVRTQEQALAIINVSKWASLFFCDFFGGFFGGFFRGCAQFGLRRTSCAAGWALS